jgi:hypothetical protein
MDSKITHQIREFIERKAQSRVSPTEFEMAYQARVAGERIRFAKVLIFASAIVPLIELKIVKHRTSYTISVRCVYGYEFCALNH